MYSPVLQALPQYYDHGQPPLSLPLTAHYLKGYQHWQAVQPAHPFRSPAKILPALSETATRLHGRPHIQLDRFAGQTGSLVRQFVGHGQYAPTCSSDAWQVPTPTSQGRYVPGALLRIAQYVRRSLQYAHQSGWMPI